MVESVQMESTRARYGITTLRVVNWSPGLQGGENPELRLVRHEEGFLPLREMLETLVVWHCFLKESKLTLSGDDFLKVSDFVVFQHVFNGIIFLLLIFTFIF